MFEIEKTFTFEAGHSLCHHDGKCKDPHGHSYILIVTLRSKGLIQEGPKKHMVADFGDVSDVIRPLIKSHLDHKWLNDTLESDSPTAEYIAFWIYHKIKKSLPQLYSVTVFETATSKAVFREEG